MIAMKQFQEYPFLDLELQKVDADVDHLTYVLRAYNKNENDSFNSAFMIEKDKTIVEQLKILKHSIDRMILHHENKL